jgi:c(7)-type cytochrome triheme protein
MKTLPNDAQEQSEMVVASHPISVARRVALAAIILFSICAVAILNRNGATAVTNQLTAWRQLDSLKSVGESPAADYSKFSHSSPREHADLMGRANCASCHRRNDGSVEPKFPLHRDCTGCHLVQFTASKNSSSVNPICTICHKPEALNSSNPPLKNFPRLVSFAAEFDHVQHLKGIAAARPTQGCTACHSPANRGVAQTIPARLNAHRVCYECHSPGQSASKTSSCGSCHRLGSYSPTSTAARAYRFGFSHAAHTERQRLTCDSCHNLRGRGLQQTVQVSSVPSAQHYTNPRAQSCATCHNSQRAFGDKGPNFDDCKRCHKGLKFGA